MKAVILAAGRGSRVNEQTANKPKGMIEMLGRPLLDWGLEALREAGIEDITIVGGYRHEMLPHDDVTVIINPIWDRTNMVSSMRCAGEIMSNSETIVSYSDILYHPSIVRSLMAASGDIATTYDRLWLGLWETRFEDPLDDAESFRVSDGKITDIGRKVSTLDEINGQYMGLLKFTQNGWSEIESYFSEISKEALDRLDMTTLLQTLIARGQSITAVPIDGRWCEVDTATDLAAYSECLYRAPEEPWSHDWR